MINFNKIDKNVYGLIGQEATGGGRDTNTRIMEARKKNVL